MTSLYKPITLILEFLPIVGHDLEMSCAKFQGNQFWIDGEIDENHALQIIMS